MKLDMEKSKKFCKPISFLSWIDSKYVYIPSILITIVMSFIGFLYGVLKKQLSFGEFFGGGVTLIVLYYILSLVLFIELTIRVVYKHIFLFYDWNYKLVVCCPKSWKDFNNLKEGIEWLNIIETIILFVEIIFSLLGVIDFIYEKETGLNFGSPIFGVIIPLRLLVVRK